MRESEGRAADPFGIPEVTRGLRAFASPSALGELHDRYFAPLLDARRAAKLANRWSSRLTALDAERLEATMRATLQTFAADQHPNNAPERRGLTAQLEDACGEMLDALTELGHAAETVHAAADDEARVPAWRVWVAKLARVFAAADRGWESASRMLNGTGATRAPRRSTRRTRKR